MIFLQREYFRKNHSHLYLLIIPAAAIADMTIIRRIIIIKITNFQRENKIKAGMTILPHPLRVSGRTRIFDPEID
jgi:hypothetical protein